MTYFPVRLRAASVVERWSVIHTIKRDNIATHSWYVVVYCLLIARLTGWQGNLARLLTEAALHDLEECVTGDIVGVVKHEIIDARKNSNFVSRKLSELMPSLVGIELPHELGETFHQDYEYKQIIKAADRLEALFFMLGEQALGNAIIAARVPPAMDRLKEAWFSLPCEEMKRLNTWNGTVLPAVEAHKDTNAYDVG